MTHQISRRTLAKGAVWSVPAVAATSAIPAFAASTCSLESQAAIDAAFAVLPETVPLELNLYQPLAASNGFAQPVYVNFKNTGTEPITFDAANPLIIKVEDVNLNPDLPSERLILGAGSSFGEITSQGYDAATKTHTWIWTFVGTIEPNRESDFVINYGGGGTGRGRLTNFLRFTPVALTAPTPALSSIVATPEQQALCGGYYSQKYAEYNATVQLSYVYRGTLASGTLAVNTPIESRDFGNFSSGIFDVNKDGIF